MSRTVSALAFAALLAACSRAAPSPEYDRARELWNAARTDHGEEAADDPRAEEALTLLARVPPRSADAEAAADLRGRIEGARVARAAERARRAELLARAGQPAPPPAPGGEAAPGAGPGGVADARDPFALGMQLQDFRAATGECFERQPGVAVAGADGGAAAGAEAWALRGDPDCAARYPSLAGRYVLFEGGALSGTSSQAAAKRTERARQVEVAPLPDGGLGIRTDAGVVPPPEGTRLVPLDGGSAPGSGGAADAGAAPGGVP
jgi:hypothetical protein